MKLRIIAWLFVAMICLNGRPGIGGMLTFTFDDGSMNTHDVAYPILESHSLKGVAYVISRRALSTPKHPAFMGKEELLSLQADGWEIGSHSVSHSRLTELPLTYHEEVLIGWKKVHGMDYTYQAQYGYASFYLSLIDDFAFNGSRVTAISEVEENANSYWLDSGSGLVYLHLADSGDPSDHTITGTSVQRELEQSLNDLEATGLIIRSFAAPYGAINDEVMLLVSQYYDSVVGGYPSGQIDHYNRIPLIDSEPPYRVVRKGVRNDTEPSEIMAYIDEALEHDYWLILAMHAIYDDESDPYGWSPEKFTEVARYAQTSGVEVVTVSEGIDRLFFPRVDGQLGLSVPDMRHHDYDFKVRLSYAGDHLGGYYWTLGSYEGMSQPRAFAYAELTDDLGITFHPLNIFGTLYDVSLSFMSPCPVQSPDMFCWKLESLVEQSRP